MFPPYDHFNPLDGVPQQYAQGQQNQVQASTFGAPPSTGWAPQGGWGSLTDQQLNDQWAALSKQASGGFTGRAFQPMVTAFQNEIDRRAFQGELDRRAANPQTPIATAANPTPRQDMFTAPSSGGGGGSEYIAPAVPMASAPAPAPAVPSQPASNPTSGAWADLYKQLMSRAQQSLTLDRTDPTIRNQSNAYAANEERSRRNYLGDIAERMGPLANLMGETRMSAEHMGQRVSGFEAELMGRELETRRQEIVQAMSEMRGMLTDQQQMALQKELALITDATQRYGIATGSQDTRYGIDVNAATSRYGSDASAGASRAASGVQYDTAMSRLAMEQILADREWAAQFDGAAPPDWLSF